MRRSGVRFISPAPIQITVHCYLFSSEPFFFGRYVRADVRRFCESSPVPDNSLRITRILKSLNSLGLAIEAKAFQSGLQALCESEPNCGIDKIAMQFWRDAVAMN